MVTWRDIKSPFSGGAELLTHGLLKKLTKDYEITVLTSAYPNCYLRETIDNITYIRLGSKKNNYVGRYNWRVYFSVFKYWYLHIRNKQHFDVVIEQINNVPFFYSLYADKDAIILIHQLCRENWFHQVPKALAWIGYFIFEPLYLWLLRNKNVITISSSTKNELEKYGFKPKNIRIISKGINLQPIESLSKVQKYPTPTLLSLGDVRPMKRTHHHIQIFELAKEQIKDLRLIIVGKLGGAYGVQLLDLIDKTPHRKDIQYSGWISDSRKSYILSHSHIVLMTSTREGWGLVVTEANSKGTIAAVYDVPGLRDSVVHMQTGIISKPNDMAGMAQCVVGILNNKPLYKKLQNSAHRESKKATFTNSCLDFVSAINYFKRAQIAGKDKKQFALSLPKLQTTKV